MALLQFSTCDRPTTAVPTSIHCDHLISAFEGAEADLKVRRGGSSCLVFFLRTLSAILVSDRY